MVYIYHSHTGKLSTSFHTLCDKIGDTIRDTVVLFLHHTITFAFYSVTPFRNFYFHFTAFSSSSSCHSSFLFYLFQHPFEPILLAEVFQNAPSYDVTE